MIAFLIEASIAVFGLCVLIFCRQWGPALIVFALLLKIVVIQLQRMEINELTRKP